MKSFWIIMSLIPVALGVASCEDNAAPEPVRPVIEGWIDSGGYPHVIFSSTFIIGGDSESLSDNLIRWGKVTVSDGERSIIMTGRMDRNYFPPFVYGTLDMVGEPGRTYSIRAEYKGMVATARATMPPLPEVTAIESVPIVGTDTLRSVTVTIKAPEEVPAYYHISTQVLPYEKCFLPAAFGCIMATEPNQELKVPVYRGKTSMVKEFTPSLPSHRSVRVRVERVTEQVYNFWEVFNEATLFGGSLFVGQAPSLPGNVTGGLGYWSPQAVRIFTVDPL